MLKPSLDPQDHHLRKQSGQLIVEYVLLLLIATAIAMIIRVILVRGGETPTDAGAVLQKWNAVSNTIGKDDPNKR